jgi:TPP-dependent pyruvate/acetoin dehydrogenase alpha subunit
MESKDKLIKMYRDMVRIRRFEETVSDLFSQDRIRGTTHLYIGEKLWQWELVNAINPDDYIDFHSPGMGTALPKVLP